MSRIVYSLILTLACVSDVAAQACCTTTGTTEFAVVGECRQAIVGAQFAVNNAHGSYDRSGQYRELSTVKAVDSLLLLAAATRLSNEEIQAGVTLPLRHNFRSIEGAGRDSEFGVGDLGLVGRYTLSRDPMTGFGHDWRPFFDVVARMTLPTGARPEQSAAGRLGVDLMGEGVLATGLGVRVAAFVAPTHSLSLASEYDLRYRWHQSQWANDTLSARFSYLHIAAARWSLGAVLSYRQLFESESNDRETVGSMSMRFGLYASYAVQIPHWDVVVSGSSDVPRNDFGRNISYAGTTFALGLRRNFL